MTINVGVIGLGFMGRTHLAAYANVPGAAVVAVADPRAAALDGGAGWGNLSSGAAGANIPEGAARYTDARQLIADRNVHALSICTPTDTHVELAEAALRAGKHVLVEKPLCIEPADARRVAELALRTRRVCMPAMCMRHWPGWPWLREATASKGGRAPGYSGPALGRLRGVSFRRLGSRPTWSPEFYADTERTGGALTDLHVHDADFILWALGKPTRVFTSGTLDHVHSVYEISNGEREALRVTAEGGWDNAPGWPFTMHYTAVFERATVDWNLSRSPHLMVYAEGKEFSVDLPAGNAYELQARHFIEAVSASDKGAKVALVADVDDGVAVAELLDAERESLRRGEPVAFAG
ncbi:MAG: Gfo/Idh/MocA family oxidoreductase [Planctomycetota bacterium]|nr:Gfo/Idh/MocA family oxidoreductase [Planctomycetota bacterium]